MDVSSFKMKQCLSVKENHLELCQGQLNLTVKKYSTEVSYSNLLLKESVFEPKSISTAGYSGNEFDSTVGCTINEHDSAYRHNSNMISTLPSFREAFPSKNVYNAVNIEGSGNIPLKFLGNEDSSIHGFVPGTTNESNSKNNDSTVSDFSSMFINLEKDSYNTKYTAESDNVLSELSREDIYLGNDSCNTNCVEGSDNSLAELMSKYDWIPEEDSPMNSPNVQIFKHDSSCPDFQCNLGKSQQQDMNIIDSSERNALNYGDKENEVSSSEPTVSIKENNELHDYMNKVHDSIEENVEETISDFSKYIYVEKGNHCSSYTEGSDNDLSELLRKEDWILDFPMDSSEAQTLKYDSASLDIQHDLSFKSQQHGMNIPDVSEANVSSCGDKEKEVSSSELTVSNNESSKISDGMNKVHESTEGNDAETCDAIFNTHKSELERHSYDTKYTAGSDNAPSELLRKDICIGNDGYNTNYVEGSDNAEFVRKYDWILDPPINSPSTQNFKYDSASPNFQLDLGFKSQQQDMIITNISERNVLNNGFKENEVSSSELRVSIEENNKLYDYMNKAHGGIEENVAESLTDFSEHMYVEKGNHCTNYTDGSNNDLSEILSKEDRILDSPRDSSKAQNSNYNSASLDIQYDIGFKSQHMDITDVSETNALSCGDTEKEVSSSELAVSNNESNKISDGTNQVHEIAEVNAQKREYILRSITTDQYQAATDYVPVCPNFNKIFDLNSEKIYRKKDQFLRSVELFPKDGFNVPRVFDQVFSESNFQEVLNKEHNESIKTKSLEFTESFKSNSQIENVTVATSAISALNKEADLKSFLSYVKESSDADMNQENLSLKSLHLEMKILKGLKSAVLTNQEHGNAKSFFVPTALNKENNEMLMDMTAVYKNAKINFIKMYDSVLNCRKNSLCSPTNNYLTDTANELVRFNFNNNFEANSNESVQKDTEVSYTENVFPKENSKGSSFFSDTFNKEYNIINVIKSSEFKEQFNSELKTDALNTAVSLNSTKSKEHSDLQHLLRYFNENCSTLIDYIDSPYISTNESSEETKQASSSSIFADSSEGNQRNSDIFSGDTCLITEELCNSINSENIFSSNSTHNFSESSECLDLDIKSTESVYLKGNILDDNYATCETVDANGVSLPILNLALEETKVTDLSSSSFELNPGKDVDFELASVTVTDGKNAVTNQTNFECKYQPITEDSKCPYNIIPNKSINSSTGMKRKNHFSNIFSKKSKDLTNEIGKEFQSKRVPVKRKYENELNISTEVVKQSKRQFTEQESNPVFVSIPQLQDDESNIQHLPDTPINTAVIHPIKDLATQQQTINFNMDIEESFGRDDHNHSRHHSPASSKSDFHQLIPDGGDCFITLTESVTKNKKDSCIKQPDSDFSTLHAVKSDITSSDCLPQSSYSDGESINGLNVMSHEKASPDGSGTKKVDYMNSKSEKHISSAHLRNLRNSKTKIFRNCTAKKHYICRFCSEKFNCRSLAKAHQRKHIGKKIFICILCNRAYRKDDALKSHLYVFHHIKKDSGASLERYKRCESSSTCEPLEMIADRGSFEAARY